MRDFRKWQPKKVFLWVLVLLTILTLSAPMRAHAEELNLSLNPVESAPQLPTVKPTPKQHKKKVHVTYKVKHGDTLTKVAKKHHTTWTRLWQKNRNLKNPNVLYVNTKVTIPFKSEKLKARKLPKVPNYHRQIQAPRASYEPRRAPVSTFSRPSGAIPGNSYDYGYCTWYVKNQRPDIPNGLGNASGWISMANSGTPRVGAVAVNTNGFGHVAIVLAIDGNRTLVKHMNWHGWNVASQDWVDMSYWSGYIL